MARTNFENLKVYRLSEDLADEIWEIASRRTNFGKDTVGKQIVKSADSIGANIAEGTGRGSYADNKRFVRTARGSLYETRHWLRRAYRRKMLTEAQIERLRPLVDNRSPMLNSYLKSIGKAVATESAPESPSTE